eukprot:14559374-Alexandrium_andersonii.AAC.1
MLPGSWTSARAVSKHPPARASTARTPRTHGSSGAGADRMRLRSHPPSDASLRAETLEAACLLYTSPSPRD